MSCRRPGCRSHGHGHHLRLKEDRLQAYDARLKSANPQDISASFMARLGSWQTNKLNSWEPSRRSIPCTRHERCGLLPPLLCVFQETQRETNKKHEECIVDCHFCLIVGVCMSASPCERLVYGRHSRWVAGCANAWI